ncbi:C-C motif chemokine 16 [Erinaceus europaeus]|uniref:C-C motif chemokine 16 n=1 Tax=Erinaceus europaeus TaxID=9365 RepID=A0A1S2ZC14_ERIEU|nr:C-C motif chemokine 16 [Erinaceus europaeus]
MKVSMAALLLLALILTSTSVAQFQSRIPESVNSPLVCCHNYTKKTLRRKMIVGYRRALNCNLPAIIFVNKRKQEICANPQEKWVQDYIKDASLPLLPPRNLV